MTIFVLKNKCFEQIPICYQNKLHYVDQVTRKTISWSINAPFKADNSDQ